MQLIPILMSLIQKMPVPLALQYRGTWKILTLSILAWKLSSVYDMKSPQFPFVRISQKCYLEENPIYNGTFGAGLLPHISRLSPEPV